MKRVRILLVQAPLWLAVPGILGAGCQGVPVHQQRFVARPSMQFSDSAVYADSLAMLSQVETGAAGSGGSQAAGCTSCR